MKYLCRGWFLIQVLVRIVVLKRCRWDTWRDWNGGVAASTQFKMALCGRRRLERLLWHLNCWFNSFCGGRLRMSVVLGLGEQVLTSKPVLQLRFGRRFFFVKLLTIKGRCIFVEHRRFEIKLVRCIDGGWKTSVLIGGLRGVRIARLRKSRRIAGRC